MELSTTNFRSGFHGQAGKYCIRIIVGHFTKRAIMDSIFRLDKNNHGSIGGSRGGDSHGF